MKNRDYWKSSLENVLQNESITDELVENIISISEMEHEYTNFESSKLSKNTINPFDSKIKELEKEIRIYKNALCAIHKADSVRIVGERVEWERRTN